MIRDNKIDDRLLLAAAAGTIAAVGANLFLYVVNLFIRGNTVNMPQLALEIFLNIGPYNLLQQLLGFCWSLIVGGIYAFIYVLILDWTGWKHLALKSVIVVSGTWLFMAGLTMKSMNLAQATRNEPASIAAFYVAHLVFAMQMAYLINRLGGRTNR